MFLFTVICINVFIYWTCSRDNLVHCVPLRTLYSAHFAVNTDNLYGNVVWNVVCPSKRSRSSGKMFAILCKCLTLACINELFTWNAEKCHCQGHNINLMGFNPSHIFFVGKTLEYFTYNATESQARNNSTLAIKCIFRE